MNDRSMPRWMVVLLAVVGGVVLGPPLLALLFGALGLMITLTGAMLKLGVLALAVYLGWRMLRALFGGASSSPAPAIPAARQTVEASGISLEQEERERRAELDRELERAVAQAQGRGGGRPSGATS